LGFQQEEYRIAWRPVGFPVNFFFAEALFFGQRSLAGYNCFHNQLGDRSDSFSRGILHDGHHRRLVGAAGRYRNHMAE
jgi:hypothetical protein